MFITCKWKDLNKITKFLNANKLAIVPTDTVFGIISKDATLIYQIKKRSLKKPLVIFISEIKQANGLTKTEQKVISKYWPGALTIIKNKIGYRIPKHKNLLKLISKTGPLYSSSANLSTKSPIKSINEAKIIFQDYPGDVILVKDVLIKSIPSTIIDLDKNKVVRNGKIVGHNVIKEILNK